MTKSKTGMRNTLTEHYARYGHPFSIGFDPSTANPHPFLESQLKTKDRESFLTAWYQSVLEGIGPMSGSIKFQSAFFEACGLDGMRTLKKLIADAKRRGLYVILDAKRGDIATTMHAYGEAAFDELGADALTILPWMGVDVVSALGSWMKKGHGVYTVWLSSNPAGRALQTAETQNNKSFAELMYRIWEEWAAFEDVSANCGYVLGATDIPNWCHSLLAERPQCLLMPGLGAQGGKITKELKALIEKNPASLLPISRGILSPEPNEKIKSWSEYAQGVETRWNDFINEWQSLN